MQGSQHRLEAGRVCDLAPGVRRILAPNPSALTGPGTNTYLVGDSALAVIDPGPDSDAHLAAILGAVGPGQRISHIIVTHAHIDHTALVARLKAATGAPVLAFGTARAGANPAFAAMTGLGGGEGSDHSFVPDQTLADGVVIEGAGWALQVIHTPGHLGSHISLALGDAVFSGDQAMGWSTSIVSPPEGDMAAYMASLDRLIAQAPAVLWPGHGEEVRPAIPRLHELRSHRLGREAQILAALAAGEGTAAELAARVYTDIDAKLLPAASRNVLAHLLDLAGKSAVTARPAPGVAAVWSKL